MKKYFILILTMVLFGITSCEEDFLIREPITTQTPDAVLSDFDGLNLALVGAYGSLYSTSYYGAQIPIIADLAANNAKKSPKESGRYTDFYLLTYTPSATFGLWGRAYFMIMNVNNVLTSISSYQLNPGEEQATLDHYKAEALFLRALGHFDLVRIYAKPYTDDPNALGVPIMLVSEIGKPARNTNQEVYNQIISDLTTALPLFDSDFNREGGLNQKTWANEDAANALLARVYLYMGDYTNAALYADKVIKSGNYTMFTPANYTTSWSISNPSEVIMQVGGDLGSANNGWWEEVGYMTWSEGYGDVCATNELYDLYEVDDIRKAMFQNDVKGDYSTYWWINKYPGKTDPNRRDNNIPLFRLSEMYLIRAEAAISGAPTAGTTALDDINIIRTNRDATPLVATPNMAEILRERRMELCFEGHIFFDYKRLKITMNRPNEEGMLPVNSVTLSYPDHRWAFPIPLSETAVNENIVQNDY